MELEPPVEAIRGIDSNRFVIAGVEAPVNRQEYNPLSH